MKTISDYTIYCTPEQTKKALALGAKIKTAMSKYNASIANKNCEQGKESFDEYQKKGIIFLSNGFSAMAYIIPTAEQMKGWLRTKGFAFGITEYNDGFNDHVFWRVANNQDKRWYKSDNKLKDPKEAFLAAIDAALEYLSKKKLNDMRQDIMSL